MEDALGPKRFCGSVRMEVRFTILSASEEVVSSSTVVRSSVRSATSSSSSCIGDVDGDVDGAVSTSIASPSDMFCIILFVDLLEIEKIIGTGSGTSESDIGSGDTTSIDSIAS
jgi:hypothetical protein